MTQTAEPSVEVRQADREAIADEVAAAPRRLIPSVREQLAGKPKPDYVGGGNVVAERARGEAFRDYTRRLDPRTFTGGQSPWPLLLIVITGSFGAIEGQLSILYPEMRRDLGISLVLFVTIFSAVTIFSQLLAPVAGYLGDRLPRTRMLVVGNAGFGIGTILMSTVHSSLSFFGIQIARNTISAPNFPITTPLLADYYPPDSRGRVLSFQSLVTITAGLVGLALVGVLGERLGWRPTYVALAIPSLVVGTALIFLKEPRRGQMDGAPAVEGLEEPPPVGVAETLRICAGIKTLRRLWYAQPMVVFGAGGIYTILLFYMADTLHFSIGTRAFVSGVTTVGSILGLFLFAPLIDSLMSYRPGRVLTLIGVLLAVDMVAFLLMAVFAVPIIVFGLLFTVALVNAPTAAASGAIESTIIPARVRTLGMQLKGLFGLVGLAFIPVVAAIEQNIGFAAAMVITAPVFVVGAILTISAGGQVENDRRAARAANAAAEEAAKHRRGESRKVLICRDVDVEYDGVQVLFHVDFDVDQGELVALLGTNGAGKSTLLRAITGLTEASNGAIFFDGDDITHTPPYDIARRGVVLMPGGRGVFPGMTVAENLALADWLARDADSVAARRRRVLDDFFPVLKQRLNQKAGSLSGGEQQMLSLAQAFVMEARLLLIDELSLGLAPAVVEQLLGVLQEIRAAGTTVLMVEQSVELALRVADRAVFMEKGEVRFSGPAAELRTRQDLLRSVFLRGGAQGSTVPAGAGPRRATGTAPDIALEVKGLSSSYGGVKALDGVSLHVARGEVLGLIGPNGAGKTTLFDAISGFVSADTGQVQLAGRDITLWSPDARARAGLTRAFQDSTLFPTMTVRETLVTALEKLVRARYAVMTATWLPATRHGETLLARRADRLIETFNLQAFADRFVVELSTGTRRVLGMAVVAATEPEVILLDEPSSGLAQTETQEMGPLLSRLQQETGAALLVIEHDMKLISAVSDRLVAMDLGRVITEGSPTEVLSDDRVAAAYLGTSIKKTAIGATARPEE